ncbi:PUL domain-containing protein [Hirsutella rhossiliensis]|uniref:PUL domain-containing protein n=1 Tax=Hirsutella rhossiliensis TaxID=111463 RepID=A0A9P8N1N2_9HYPO|nr:PUL domain-containing protein [Hirsutella rhossiliensis]KAH0965282.1 PUL domain-containing protein [Hirsutella rhossiliensis]
MDVHLLVYDLSRGLARQMSMPLVGFQLDAVYHTSVELNGREYVYDGGIIAITPGSSHLGQPMQRMHLGTTHLPLIVIEEFLDSLRPIFTLEAYDLFRHNCNNFTDSFSNFLVGKGIPAYITNMPQAVLESPMGRTLFTQLSQGVNAGRSNGSILGLEQSARPPAPNPPSQVHNRKVQIVARQEDLFRLLDEAKRSCAVIFFTSATCPPCKALYPIYDQLADEFGTQASFIKIDVALPQAAPIAQAYSISATPTFVTFLKGEQENRWSGADPAGLRGNVQLLVQMAHPAHPHEKLRLPSFSNPDARPVLFPKMPPVAKLTAKMGDELPKNPEVQSLIRFIETRGSAGAQNALIPDMSQLSRLMRESVDKVAPGMLFTVVDLFRCALVDPRISGFYAEEKGHETVRRILEFVNEQDDCPYALRLVTLQMGCNLFSTPLFPEEIVGNEALRTPITQLISSSFLDDSHNNVRVAASSLLFNLALANRHTRSQEPKATLPEGDQVELAASVIEAISQEDKSAEALQGMLSALGHLVYGSDLSGELADLLRAMDAQGTVAAKRRVFPAEKLVLEVADELLGKGLARP